jgi:hypothetical protein
MFPVQQDLKHAQMREIEWMSRVSTRLAEGEATYVETSRMPQSGYYLKVSINWRDSEVKHGFDIVRELTQPCTSLSPSGVEML